MNVSSSSSNLRVFAPSRESLFALRARENLLRLGRFDYLDVE